MMGCVVLSARHLSAMEFFLGAGANLGASGCWGMANESQRGLGVVFVRDRKATIGTREVFGRQSLTRFGFESHVSCTSAVVGVFEGTVSVKLPAVTVCAPKVHVPIDALLCELL